MPIKLRFLLLSLLLTYGTALLAQPGEWGDFFSYYQSSGIAYTHNECACYTKSSILRYNFQTGERTKLSKLNGLSEADILHVSLSVAGELWVSYASGRVEHHTPEGSRQQYRDLEEQVLHGLRQPIHHLLSTGANTCVGISPEYLYYFSDGNLQHGFRLWGKNQSVLTLNAIAALGDKVYVGTSDGVYVLEKGGKEVDYKKLGTLNGNISSLTADAEQLIAVRRLSLGYELWRISDSKPWTKVAERPTALENEITLSNQRILVAEGETLLSIDLTGHEEILHNDATEPTERQFRAVNAFFAADGSLYVASKHRGLLHITGGNSESLSPISPAFVACSHLLAVGENEVVLANGEPVPATTIAGRERALFYYQSSTQEGINVYVEDGTRATALVLLDASAKRFAVATDNAGVFIFEEAQRKEQINAANSPLPAAPSGKTTYINALASAPDGTLYLCAGNTGTLFRRAPDGSFASAPLPRNYGRSELRLMLSRKGVLFLSSSTLSEITAIEPTSFFSSNGNEGIASQYVMGEQMTHLTTPRDFGFDSGGDLWVGTDDGLIRARTPEQLLDGKRLTFNATFIYTAQDGQSALFEGVRIDHLAIDAGDRLWTYSPNKGLMQVDPTRRLLLQEYLVGNSPLPSNWINALVYENKRGVLYVATNNGAVSLITTSNEASKAFDAVRIYPNPVRPDFTGLLTIDGLIENSYVKIVDAGGELVRELQSNGGRATWDLRNGYGNKVASGVYFVLISHEGTKQGYAGKFAVIR